MTPRRASPGPSRRAGALRGGDARARRAENRRRLRTVRSDR
ncbi:hypothetical protein HMPREF0043_01050 [Actinobaculum sp. oral taxon 183 str. F0552]|nr:hypothetical protein HMPREF0043_01050 [Actinobaculum sp. oral taxon 183 str. F0552]